MGSTSLSLKNKSLLSMLFLNHQRALQFFIAVALLACFLNFSLLGYLIAYAVPIADDYCYGSVGGLHNAVAYANNSYTNWTGRWTSQAIECLLFSAFNLYHSVPIILAALFVLRFLALLYLLSGTLQISPLRSAFWSALLTATWLSVSPGIGEGTLWATGVTEYQLPLTLALFALGLISRSKCGLAVPFIIVATTMNELVALILTGTCVSMLWTHRRDSRSLRALVPLTVLAAGFTLFVLFAPGTFVRAAQTYSTWHNHRPLFSHLLSLVSQMAAWTIAPTTVGVLLLLAATLEKNTPSKPLLDLIGWPFVLLGLTVTIAMIPYESIPGRAWSLLCFVWLLFLFFSVTWLVSYLEIGSSARVIGLLLFSLGAIKSSNFKDMRISSRQAPAWNHALKDRINTHHFDRINWPPSYFWEDVTSNSSYWLNDCVAKYHGLPPVSCSSCPPP